GGVRVGDIVTRLNGRDVTGIAVLRSMIATTRPGDTIRLKVVREGTVTDLSITLADREEGQKLLAEIDQRLNRFGIQAILGVEGGVQLQYVREGSDASLAGFASGQVVTRVEGTPIQSSDTFLSRLRAAGFIDGSAVKITVMTKKGEELEFTARMVRR
ncbi:MAG: PDZ domain-containing protein, partial [Acidimicrobiales bacterium]